MESTRPLEAETASLRRAPADPTRRRIRGRLRAGPAITGEIAATFPISRIAVTRHVEVLAEAGPIASRKRAEGVGTVSTLSRWIGCAGAGLDRSRPASPRDSSAYCVPSGTKIYNNWVLTFFWDLPLDHVGLGDLIAAENPLVLESLPPQ